MTATEHAAEFMRTHPNTLAYFSRFCPGLLRAALFVLGDEDVRGAAHVAVMMAAERFDQSRGVLFGVYSSWWFRNVVQQELRKHNRQMRDGRRTVRSSELTGWRADDWDFLEETVRDERCSDPADDAAVRELGDLPANARRVLTADEFRVLELRCGLDGNGERSFSEIGHEIGKSKQRASQIWENVKRKLRRRLAAWGDSFSQTEGDECEQ